MSCPLLLIGKPVCLFCIAMAFEIPTTDLPKKNESKGNAVKWRYIGNVLYDNAICYGFHAVLSRLRIFISLF